MMYGWNDQPTKAKLKHYIADGDNRAAVYEIASTYEVTVHPDESVTYVHKRRHTSDPRSVFPNMEVGDEQICIPITDLVATVLSRLEPYDLARALWDDQSVRSEFMDCLVQTYNSGGLDDGDRRKFLAGVKERVHSKALDNLVSTVAKVDREAAKQFDVYRQVDHVNAQLRGWGVLKPDGKLLQIEVPGHDRAKWDEAHKHWREETLKRFPTPEQAPS